MNIEDMSYEELRTLYASLLGVDENTLEESLVNEVRSAVSNELRSKDSTLSGEDLDASVEMEMDALGEDGIHDRASTNIIGYIEQIAQRNANSDIQAMIDSGSMTFPYKGTFDLSNGLHVELEVTKMHERRFERASCGT